MINRLKQSVKSSMMRRKIEEYEAALDEQYESYHDWILKREKEYRETLSEEGGAALRIFVSMSATGSDALIFLLLPLPT